MPKQNIIKIEINEKIKYENALKEINHLKEINEMQQLKCSELEKSHAVALTELEKSHTVALNELEKSHAVALNEIENLNKTIQDLLQFKTNYMIMTQKSFETNNKMIEYKGPPNSTAYREFLVQAVGKERVE
jgi:hypothetical protein